jgi:tripartite-type tricarboxylate transporter receptor subunit TctC
MMRALLAVVALLATPALAQEAWPSRPVRMLVGFPPGGGIDLLSRALAADLAKAIGQPVVVENRGGAGGNLAADAVAKAAPDGYTLGAIPAGPMVINRHLYRSMPFDPLADFRPIAQFAAIPVVLLGANALPARDLPSLVAHVKAAASPLPCGTPGASTTQHLATLMLMQALGTECTLVHYRGTGPALPDLISGTIALYTDTVVTGLPPARDGRARALAVLSAARIPQAPDVPAAAETVPGFVAETWLGLFGPRALPEAIAARLEAATIAAARDPAVVSRLAELGAVPTGVASAPLAALIREQDARWGPVARASGATVD